MCILKDKTKAGEADGKEMDICHEDYTQKVVG
jgi:hypothetical protein